MMIMFTLYLITTRGVTKSILHISQRGDITKTHQ
jgi:hypothetical protein